MRHYSKYVREESSKYIELPLKATKYAPLFFDTIAYFTNGVHCDPENVHKLVKDSLFYTPPEEGKNKKKKRGSDKYTGGFYDDPLYDKDNPRVEITLYSLEEAPLLGAKIIERMQKRLTNAKQTKKPDR